MNPYNMSNEEALALEGWKTRNYKNLSKKDLLEYIECLEHNWAGEIKANKLLSQRLENFLNYFERCEHPELFRDICMIPEERWHERIEVPEAQRLVFKDSEEFWFNAYMQELMEKTVLSRIIEDIASYKLYTYETDYDYNDEIYDYYEPFDIGYIIDNTTKTEKLERREENEQLLKSTIQEKHFIKEDDEIEILTLEPERTYYNDEIQ